MDEEQDSPQTTKLIWWILGALLTVVLGGGSTWMNHVAAQVDDLRQEQKVDAQDRAAIRERTSKLETKLDMVIESTRQTTAEIRELRDDIRRALEHNK